MGADSDIQAESRARNPRTPLPDGVLVDIGLAFSGCTEPDQVTPNSGAVIGASHFEGFPSPVSPQAYAHVSC